MKILNVIPSISHSQGGPSRAIRSIEKALALYGLTLETATTDDDGADDRVVDKLVQSAGEPFVKRWYFRRNIDFYKVSWSFVPWLMRNVRRFDIVHIHAMFSFTSVAAAWAARRAGVPYVIRPLGTLATYGVTQRRPWLKRLSLKWIEGPLLRDAAAVHFTSADEMREAAQTGIPMNGVVISLGIEAFTPSDGTSLAAHLPALQGKRFLLYLSRLDPKKNLEGLLRAFSQCTVDWPDLKLLVAGDGDAGYVAGLKGLSGELGLADSVVWAGHIDGALKASALAGAELFVLPSFSENFGIAAAEALMAGLPCVLGQGVAISQDVVNAGAGVVVMPDPASIATGLMQVMADVQARTAMSERAVALAQGKFSAQAMGSNLVALYKDIWGQRQTLASKMVGAER